MKRFTKLVVAVAVVSVFASTATAHATQGETWHSTQDYYNWTLPGEAGVVLKDVGDNPTKPGVHANYTANTAKCGICHSVHRAKAGGEKLLNTDNATCEGCHRAGATTVTDVLIAWGQGGGPHESSSPGGCATRACHVDNPHGANGSQYAIVAEKLLNAKADTLLTAAAADLASGITVADLNNEATPKWDDGTRSAVRSGYTCNVDGCHFRTMLTVLEEGYSEDRLSVGSNSPLVAKTGHLSVAAASMVTAFAPVNSCVSCHDQTDAATSSKFTFPHGQVAAGASNVPAPSRAYLWMTIAENAEGDDFSHFKAESDKAKDGACLKCHRSSLDGGKGIGETH